MRDCGPMEYVRKSRDAGVGHIQVQVLVPFPLNSAFIPRRLDIDTYLHRR